jgi:ATP-dependent Lon protease
MELYPTIVTRGIIGFQSEIIELELAREESINAAMAAIDSEDSTVVVLPQKNSSQLKIQKNNIHKHGVLAKIVDYNSISATHLQVTLEVTSFIKVFKIVTLSPLVYANVEPMEVKYGKNSEEARLVKALQEVINYKDLNSTQLKIIEDGTNANNIANIFASAVDMNVEEKINFIKQTSVNRKLQMLLTKIREEEELRKVDDEIERKIQESFNKNQKEFYLREKIKVIKEELGEKDNKDDYVDKIRKLIKDNPYPENIKQKLTEELNKFELVSNQGSDSNVIRSYIDWVISLPWFEKTEEKLDLKYAAEVLDKDHYGMEKVKDRILEYLAVKQLQKDYKGSIICLVGPPGVGKTSLANSIAKSLNRNFVKIALGGVKDESEIRGHRRTYLGALPGRIIQGMKRAQSINPVFLLDEIEKMGMDHKGDPSAAFLEVLDPEQNKFFSDHYIEEPYDLSQVMFIATANDISYIPGPLRDRMEIIELGGYTNLEKEAIAQKYVIPRQIKEHGLEDYKVTFTKKAIEKIITNYTLEAGVRGLEKQVMKVLRKVAKEILLNTDIKEVKLTDKNIPDYLGRELITESKKEEKDQVGVVSGLAYTSFGGDVLPIEITSYPGKGQLILTGKLGDVMKESATIAYSYVKSVFPDKKDFFKENDIHIHAPEGAVPKDGPSAGITMATALTSLVKNQKVSSNVAMTGEINLRGNVMPIGGLKEKSLGAFRAGIKTIIIPFENTKDIADIPQEVLKKVKVVPVKTMEEVLKLALV